MPGSAEGRFPSDRHSNLSVITAAIMVQEVTVYLTKMKEREADWQKYKFEHYREFVVALGGIAGADATPAGNLRFTVASAYLQSYKTTLIK